MGARTRRDSVKVSQNPAEHAREVALRLLSSAPKSAAQLRDGLVARGFDESTADEVIVRYREIGLVDDGALAAMIARTRHRERGHARRVIRDELRRKGFEAPDIEEALKEISEEDEESAAASLATRRWEALKGHPHEVRIRRVSGFLMRKGYPAGTVFPLVRALGDADR